MVWWLAAFETWAVNALLRSPTFHNTIRQVNRQYNRLRHGTPMEEMGGTKIDNQGESFFKHFKDELRAQLRGEETKRKP